LPLSQSFIKQVFHFLISTLKSTQISENEKCTWFFKCMFGSTSGGDKIDSRDVELSLTCLDDD